MMNGGKQFLGYAANNGLGEAMKLIDKSPLGDAKRKVMNEVNNGINTLQGLVQQGEQAVKDGINQVKAQGVCDLKIKNEAI